MHENLNQPIKSEITKNVNSDNQSACNNHTTQQITPEAAENEGTSLEITENQMPSFVLKPRTSYVDRDQSAIFVCRVVGQPSPSVQWRRQGQIIKNDSRFQVGDSEKGISF